MSLSQKKFDVNLSLKQILSNAEVKTFDGVLMPNYTVDDAIHELSSLINDAPDGAVRGRWMQTTIQAAFAYGEGCYYDAEDKPVRSENRKGSDIFNALQSVIEKLEAANQQPFNKMTVHWTKPILPIFGGRITIDLELDEDIIPRGPDDPIYEEAAAIRRAYWDTLSTAPITIALEENETNNHNQTRWYGPHRRVLSIPTTGPLLLATDGLSTPSAGSAEKKNGDECEVFMECDSVLLDLVPAEKWSMVLIDVGDMIATGFDVPNDVMTNEAIVFCGLDDAFLPYYHVILSADSRQIDGLPFGSIPVFRATPITKRELEGMDLDDDWWTDAAKAVLKNRQSALD